MNEGTRYGRKNRAILWNIIDQAHCIVTNDCRGYLPGSSLGRNSPPSAPDRITRVTPQDIIAIPNPIPKIKKSNKDTESISENEEASTPPDSRIKRNR